MATLALYNPDAAPTYADSLRLTITDGDAGVYDTLQVMRAAVEDAVEDGAMVAPVAAAIMATVDRRTHQLAGGGEHDPTRDTRGLVALYRWLRDHIVFKRDAWGLEHVRHPDQLLAEISAHGRTAADCDDVAVLGAALVRAIGLRPAFVLASRHERGRWEHVFFAACRGKSVFPLDPQEATPPGRWPPVRRMEVLQC